MTDEFVTGIAARLQGLAQNIVRVKPQRVFAEVPREKLLDVVKILKDEYDGYHVTVITAIDSGEKFEILYHIVAGAELFTLKVFLPRKDPTVDTLTGILPGAILYEREIHEIMGIRVKNHPDMRNLLLPDSWGEKGHPLRKDWVDPRTKGVK
jgi:NADH:ubiquinone oxidoreductase subunit C